MLLFEGAEVKCSDEFVNDPKYISKEDLIDYSEIIIIGAPHDIYKNIKLTSNKKLFDIWNLGIEFSK